MKYKSLCVMKFIKIRMYVNNYLDSAYSILLVYVGLIVCLCLNRYLGNRMTPNDGVRTTKS